MSYPERIIPEETPSGPLSAHLVRYRFAEPYCRDKVVLDAACGVGYGSHLLRRSARSVVGIDISEDAIGHASSRYVQDGLEYRTMDVANMAFPDATFDVVCSFETIEHVDDPEAFVAEIRRVLAPDGHLIISTPMVRKTKRSPDNPFHRIEYSREDFEALLRVHFRKVEILGQRRLQTAAHRVLQRLDFLKLRTRVPRGLRNRIASAVGTTPWEELDLSGFAIDSQLRDATEVVAICQGAPAGSSRVDSRHQ